MITARFLEEKIYRFIEQVVKDMIEKDKMSMHRIGKDRVGWGKVG